jgi:tetratricopeptide (TPR) repeat protein
MRTPWLERAMAMAMLGVVVLAAVLEGGVVVAYGGAVYALAVALGAAWIVARGVDPLPGLAKVGFGLLFGVLLYQALPIPEAVRALVAPGQAAWIARVAPEWQGGLDGWLQAVAAYDIAAAVGIDEAWAYDTLAGSLAGDVRPGAIAPDAWRWSAGQVLALGVVWLVGAGLGRSPVATRTILVGLLIFCVGEAIFGLANRNGDTTGIGVKSFYQGSATGTFVNRGHFAALLVLGVGCAWGLAASLFPLRSEEVLRHAARRTRSSQPPSVFEASGDRVPRLALLGFVVAVLLVAVVASQGRGPIMGLAVSGLAVGGWMAWRRKETFHLGIALAVPVVGGMLAALAFGVRGSFGRFRGLLEGDASLASRLELWRDSLVAWGDAPLFGAGLGGWPLAHALHEVPDHLYSFSNAHNEPIETLVEMGLVGVVGWVLVLLALGRGTVLALREVPHDEGTAAGVGALVAVLAVVVQSLGDFPLDIPGVALPWALLGGVAQGSLTMPARPGARGPVLAVAAVAFVLCAWAAADDAEFAGSRADRLAERGQIWADPDRKGKTVAVVARWGERAHARAAERPLDPWAHAAVAEAEARLAWAGWKVGGPRPSGFAPEDHAFRAELALTRAYTLRPRDPRLLLVLAQALAVLGDRAPTPDAFDARATRLLADAVARDGWRAEEAMAIGDTLSDDALARIAASAKGTPRALARVHTAHGKALERRGKRAEAAAAYTAAIAADGRYGPALFAAGSLARGDGDTAAAEALLRRFVSADERAGGMEGWAYILLGELDQAEMRLRRVVSQSPSNRWAWEGLAEIALQRQNVAEERSALQRILALDPNHKAALGRMTALSGK